MQNAECNVQNEGSEIKDQGSGIVGAVIGRPQNAEVSVGIKDQGSGVVGGGAFDAPRVQGSASVGTSIACPQTAKASPSCHSERSEESVSPVQSLPPRGKVPPKEADEGYPRQAAASDEALRATGSTSSVSGLAGDARCHLPLKGKAEAVASDEALRATDSTSSVTASPCHLPLEGKAEDGERETQILRCAQNDGAGDAGTALCRPQEALILSSDTVVVLDGKIMGKPHDAAEARAMLAALSGREHEVYTAFCLLPIEMQNAERNAQNAVCHCEKTYVKFRALTPEEIAAYVATGEPMDKAGAYGIQNLGAMLVESIRGDYFTVMGLPVCQLALALKGFGIDPLLRQENKS